MDNIFMKIAIDKAWEFQALTYPNPAVASLIIYKNKIIALEGHRKAGESHSELLAFYEAYLYISKKKREINKFNAKIVYNFLISLPEKFFSETILYVTLEPCGTEGKNTYKENIDFKILNSKESNILIQAFNIWKNRAFVIFKLAQSINGKIGGGYLSSKESLKHNHKLRAVCSKLLIGGNTVRIDKPTLDSRFLEKEKSPDIIIYSREKNFDKNIPLFNIPNRKVEIKNNLDFLDKPSLIIVEGGEGMLKALKNKIDWLIFYQTPKLSDNIIDYNLNLNISFLHNFKIGKDLLIWVSNSS